MNLLLTCRHRIINISLVTEFFAVEVYHNPDLKCLNSSQDSFLCAGILVYVNCEEVYLGFFGSGEECIDQFKAALGYPFTDWTYEGLNSFIDIEIDAKIEAGMDIYKWSARVKKKREEFSKGLHYEKMGWGCD